MASSRGDPPPAGPPYPGPPGPLPCPPGPPAPYEPQTYEWKEEDGITLGIRGHQVVVHTARVRLGCAQQGRQQLLEEDVNNLALSVQSVIRLLEYSIRRGNFGVALRRDIQNAIKSYRDGPLLLDLRSPDASINLKFQYYLRAMERFSAFAESLHPNLAATELGPSWLHEPEGRLPRPPSHPISTSHNRSTEMTFRPLNLLQGSVSHGVPSAERDSTPHAAFAENKTSPSINNPSSGVFNEFHTSGHLGQDNIIKMSLRWNMPIRSATSSVALIQTTARVSESQLTKCTSREFPEGEVTKFGAGESWRPAPLARTRSPHGGDTFRSDRDRDRSPRRDRGRSPHISDSYHPSTYLLRILFIEASV